MISHSIDPNAQVRVINGDASGDDTWTIEINGHQVRVRVEGGQVTDSTFTEAFRGDPDNGSVVLRTAEAAVLDAIEYADTCKGFGNHPDVVM